MVWSPAPENYPLDNNVSVMFGFIRVIAFVFKKNVEFSSSVTLEIGWSIDLVMIKLRPVKFV